MTGMLISLAVAIISLAGLCGLAARGFRIGDRPDDARVTAVLREARQPDATRPVAAVTVRNPSGTPILTGMSVRTGTPHRSLLLPRVQEDVPVSVNVSVPRWTARRRFRAALYDTVGLVPAAADAEFTVPVPEDARRYVLTVVAGQGGRRLRVHRIALAQAQSRARGERLVPPAGTRASGSHGG